jgi:hypothetical protein
MRMTTWARSGIVTPSGTDRDARYQIWPRDLKSNAPPRPDRILLLDFLKPRFDIVNSAIDFRQHHVLQRASAAHRTPVFNIEPLQIARQGGRALPLACAAWRIRNPALHRYLGRAGWKSMRPIILAMRDPMCSVRCDWAFPLFPEKARLGVTVLLTLQAK